MKTVYVSHPYNGDPANKSKVEEIIERLVRMYPDVVFISPIHTFGYMYHSVPYHVGMEWCLELQRRCDEVLLCDGWENSRGCVMEYSDALQHNQPYSHLMDWGKQLEIDGI